MKIGIIGATGNAGRAISAEAVRRGHDMTTFVRNAGTAADVLGQTVPTVAGDAFAITESRSVSRRLTEMCDGAR